MTELREKDVQIILEKYGAHEMAKAKGYAYKSIGMTQSQATKALMALKVVKPPHFIEASVCRWCFTHLFGVAEIVQTAPSNYRLDVCFNDELDGKTFSSLKGAEEAFAADYTRRILSAVNAVSEAQVRADERERVAKECYRRAKLYREQSEQRQEFHGKPCRKSEWAAHTLEEQANLLRAQEGGK